MKKKGKDLWFKPEKHTGWKHTQGSTTRRRKLLSSTPKNMKMKSRYLLAGKRALALSNVNQDKDTKAKAKSDYKYFFAKLK